MQETKNTLKEYGNIVPKALQLSLEALGTETTTRLGIMMLLIDEDGQSFDEIREYTTQDEEELFDTLSALQRGGLIEKRVGEKIGDRKTGNYHVTTIGNHILDGLHDKATPDRNTTEDDE